ncbi:MAG: ABC-F family ATP-binding cassette domain-containing protein [Myxococcota bacterium]
MSVLDASQLRKSIGDRTLLDDVTLTIRPGEKVGLVGQNGSGKSSLARVLAGLDEVDGGKIARRRDSTVGYLAQEPVFPVGERVRDVVLSSLVAWSALRRRFDELTAALGETDDPETQTRLASEQAEVGEALEREGGWEREHEAEATLLHLGIADPDRRVETLSGGEARRVALAQLLVAAPDLAILDEPTNHLDLGTIEWLEEHLRDRFDGAVLLISHDRHVLDAVTTRTLEIHHGQVESYDGGYARYLVAKAEREAHAERTWRNTRNFLRREVEWLRRMPKARGTKQKARVARAESALEERAPQVERQAELRMQSERQGKTILDLSGVALERDGRRLVSGIDLALRPGDRVGIVGPNGSGKTTLLLAIQDRLEIAAGEIERGATTKIGYLDQARSELDPKATVREAAVGDANEIVIGEERLSIGGYLERFLFDYAAQRRKVSELSGGERARVCLARLLSQKCNLLLLDEPTNDLDVMTLSALEGMLLDFGGSLLLVSHDRWLLDRVSTGILAFEPDGKTDLHVGSYSEYRARREREAARAVTPDASVQKKALAATASATKTVAKARKLTHAERRELDGMMEAIEAAEAEVERVQTRLADPETYQGDGDAVAALRAELGAAEGEVLRLNERWEALEAIAAAADAR